jgi:hypothetical protein
MHDAPFEILEVNIAASGTTSNAVHIGRYSRFALYFDANMTGATLSILGCHDEHGDDSSFVALSNEAGAITITDLGAEGIVHLEAAGPAIAACEYVKFVSASAEAAAHALKLLCKVD